MGQVIVRRARRRLPWALALPAATLAVIALALSVSPAVRTGADDFLGAFRTGRRETLSLIDLQLPLAPGVDTAAFTGALRVQLPPGQEVPSSHDAGERVDFNVRSLRRAQAPRVYVFVNDVATIAIDRPALEGALAGMAGPGIRLPAEFDTPVQARIPAAVRMVWGDAGGDLTLWLSRNPRLYTTSGPTWEEQRARLVQIAQFLAPETAQRLRGVTDWENTVIVPVPPDASTRRVRADGTDNALLIERQGRSTLIWQRYGIVHLLDGPMDGRALVSLADTLR